MKNRITGCSLRLSFLAEKPGPLLYVQDAQINVIAPWALQGG